MRPNMVLVSLDRTLIILGRLHLPSICHHRSSRTRPVSNIPILMAQNSKPSTMARTRPLLLATTSQSGILTAIIIVFVAFICD